MKSEVSGVVDARSGLEASEQRFRMIFDGLPALVCLLKPAGGVELANRHCMEFFGATLEEMQRWELADVIHPDDLEEVAAAWKNAVETGHSYEVEGRHRRADGVYRWLHMQAHTLRDEAGRVVLWYLVQTDVDDRKRAEALLAVEKQLLEMVAAGRPLPAVLDALCRFVDATAEECASSVLLLDGSGTKIAHAFAPGLPASYQKFLVGRPVNCEEGPCGMAVTLNTQVIVSDVTADPRWQRDGWPCLATSYGVKACWSSPIRSLTGELLGTLAITRREAGSPTPFHQALIQQLTHIASIAIERTQSEAALKRSEAFLAQAQRLTRTGSLWWKLSTGEIAWSDENYRLMDYPLTMTPAVEMIMDRCHPDDLSRVQDAVTRAVRDGTSMDFEHRLLMPDGSIKHVHVVVQNVGQESEHPEFVGAVTDITERKRAEAQLRRSEAYLAEAQRLSLTGSFGWSVASDEHFWSDETFRIFEYQADTKITLQSFLERVHPLDLPLVSDVIAGAVGGDNFDYECRLVMPGGALKNVHIVAHAADGKVENLEFVGAVMDITATRRAEDALRRGQAELAHVSRVMTLGELTASIAHEVNQPLSGIITNASTCLRMLAADPPNIDGARETARRTIRDGHRAADVITRLRALFGKKPPTIEAVDLNEAAREVIAISMSELQRHRVILRTEFGEDLPPVTGDRVQLQQVILNLLLNASDAMSGVDDRPRLAILRTERDADDGVCLTVQDAGVGFDPHAANRLFEAFYTTKSGGMGIGLSVSRSIIENHQGRLWAAPNPGPGATFCFSIPRRAHDDVNDEISERHMMRNS